MPCTLILFQIYLLNRHIDIAYKKHFFRLHTIYYFFSYKYCPSFRYHLQM